MVKIGKSRIEKCKLFSKPSKFHRDANGVGVNGEGVKTIKAIKTIKTIQTPKTCMRTRKLSNSYRKTIEKLQLNDLRRNPKKRGGGGGTPPPLFLSITLYLMNLILI